MTLDDLDFEDEEIHFVQQKNGEMLHLPMLPEVKAALKGYIKHARPAVDDKIVFLRHNAPYQGMSLRNFRNC